MSRGKQSGANAPAFFIISIALVLAGIAAGVSLKSQGPNQRQDQFARSFGVSASDVKTFEDIAQRMKSTGRISDPDRRALVDASQRDGRTASLAMDAIMAVKAPSEKEWAESFLVRHVSDARPLVACSALRQLVLLDWHKAESMLSSADASNPMVLDTMKAVQTVIDRERHK